MDTSLLFTGHMIDQPDRAEPRFPPALETAARRRIEQAIAPYAPGGSHAAPSVRGFASGARGGDILFHEECRARGIETAIVIPFEPDAFVASSVAFKDGAVDTADWPARFWALWNATPPERRYVLGLSPDDDAYATCNTRLLHLARGHGRVHLIAMWDGKGGDGPGGTADLVAKARTEDVPDVFSPASLREQR
jgi:hypothetical protein